MKKMLKIVALASVAIITLSGCGITKEFQKLPDEERYFYIDKVLSDIDYKNIGKSRSETRDDNGGNLTPSFKRIGFEGTDTFDEIARKLSNPKDPNIYSNCEYREEIAKKNIREDGRAAMVCSYYGMYITLEGFKNSATLAVSDSSSGRR